MVTFSTPEALHFSGMDCWYLVLMVEAEVPECFCQCSCSTLSHLPAVPAYLFHRSGSFSCSCSSSAVHGCWLCLGALLMWGRRGGPWQGVLSCQWCCVSWSLCWVHRILATGMISVGQGIFQLSWNLNYLLEGGSIVSTGCPCSVNVLGTHLCQCTSWHCCGSLCLASVNFFWRQCICPFHDE